MAVIKSWWIAPAIALVVIFAAIAFTATSSSPSSDTVDRYRGGTAPAWYREAMHWRAIAKVQGDTADRLLKLNRKLLEQTTGAP